MSSNLPAMQQIRCLSPFSVAGLLLYFFLFSVFLFISVIHIRPSLQQIFVSFPQASIVNKDRLKVYVAELPRDLNYGLLEEYWAFKRNKETKRNEKDGGEDLAGFAWPSAKIPPYPENPLIKQYSAEYWLMGDLMTPENLRENSVAWRVWNSSESDVVFVPFFGTLSAEMQLEKARGKFRHKKDNEDYERQRKVMDFVKGSMEWQRSGGRDHVFVLTDPVAMWHIRSEIAPAVLLVVDFGGWYMEDAKEKLGASGSSDTVHHTQVSLLKDVIIPYTHLLSTLHPSKDRQRNKLLYFKGARHRHRTGLVRDKLWSVLEGEQDVVLEEGFPNITGREQALHGMRNSEFCLHPAGDTPTSCRLFDAVASLCIPVIVSDNIELPFEGMLDYKEFSVFVPVGEALQPKWLVQYLRGIDTDKRKVMRKHLAKVQHKFEYANGFPGGVGPMIEDGAVNLIWTKVLQKVPAIKEAVTRERRKPGGTIIPARCQCI